MATTIETNGVSAYGDDATFALGFCVGTIIDVSNFKILRGQLMEDKKPVKDDDGNEVFIPVWNANGVNLLLHRLFTFKNDGEKRVTKLAEAHPEILGMPKAKMESAIRKLGKIKITEIGVDEDDQGRKKKYYDFDEA